MVIGSTATAVANDVVIQPDGPATMTSFPQHMHYTEGSLLLHLSLPPSIAHHPSPLGFVVPFHHFMPEPISHYHTFINSASTVPIQ